MRELTYHLPLQGLSAHRTGALIVRAGEPEALITALATEDPDRIIAVQLLSLDTDSEPLNAWAPGLPVELVMTDPAAEFPGLYRHVNLLDQHPVRVVIPVQPGFAKAVRAAVALDFAVRLEPGQPEPALIDELAAVLDFYLHQPTVAQPIEYFQGALLGFYHQEPVPLWWVLDEDPETLRYVADDGAELLYGRLAGVDVAVAPDAALTTWMDQVLATGDDCRTCEFRQSCGGYFKWPRPDYDCTGVKRLFGVLRDAADELRSDLEGGSE
ncbi:MAG TPA: hypothetical protein DCS21_12665 [Gammaproteobacteria bacterium]|nr:hypothetical protein [Gammaproteobacteria bacterium]